jgi:ketosteroid isomerase-like protein
MSDSVIRRMFECVDAADWERLSGCFHPEVRYERPGYPPLVGRDRLIRFYREERPIAESRHEIEGILLDGDLQSDGDRATGSAAAWGEMTGKVIDGDPVAFRFAEIYGFADGVIRARRSYFFTPAV